jgi:glucose dehydrogenase
MPALKASASERKDLLAWLSTLDGVKGPTQEDPPEIRREAIDAVAHPGSGDWPTYNGRLNGNRYMDLRQIDAGNVDQLQLQSTYQLPYSPLETTPLVISGQMVVTGPNQVCSLDSRSVGGRRGVRINPVRADDGSPDRSCGGHIHVPANTGPFGWTDIYAFRTLRNSIILLEFYRQHRAPGRA